ncbi:MAG: DNA repair protein RadA [Anaerovoracaceae bacterium]|jgi:DNA repair protein RadA/Sms
MAKRGKTVFVCQDCGNESPKWSGQCICGAWNTMVEERVVATKEDGIRDYNLTTHRSKAVRLEEICPENKLRIDTGISELNRVLGGGLVQGSLTLISGEPGIGKSTLLIQVAMEMSTRIGKVLYVTGEESEEQVKMRADRTCGNGLDDLYLLTETNMEHIVEVIESIKPTFLIIDSIQTMYSQYLDSAAGSVSQVRACANILMRLGKGKGIPVFMVAHVTKSGDLAGPKIIEHLVDCVLHFTGERNRELRILRSYKNRFGTTSEIGAFEMVEKGLIPIENLSESFLEGMEEGAEGSVAAAVYEGTRPLLLEIQALTSPANAGFARRAAIGIETSRLNMILAVLDRKVGISLVENDVYVNVVGGLKPEGTSTDLAVAISIFSAHTGIASPRKTLAIGEIGLTGDLRSVQHADRIIREGGRMGFTKIILPKKNKERLSPLLAEGIELCGVTGLEEAISVFSK